MTRLVWLLIALTSIAFPQGASVLQRLIQTGEEALASRRYAEAATAFEKARKLNPGIAEIHARLGVIYFQSGEFAAAVAALRQAIQLKQTLPNLDILLAMCLAETGRLEEALPGLEKGFRRTADPALKRMSGLQLQRAYTGLRRDGKAVDVALELVRVYPDDPEILYHSSRLFGNYAYLALKRLADVAPNSVWRHQAAGETRESQGQLELALTEYRQVAALDPNRPGIHYRMGRVHLGRPNAEGQGDALIAFERELGIDPTNANAAYEIGDIHRKRNEPDTARAMFERAAQLDPDFEEAQLGLGAALVTLGKPEAALPHLRKAAALNPGNEVPHYRLAQVHRLMGNAAAQQQELGEFRRIRAENAKRREPVLELRPKRDVTKQSAPEEN